MAFRTPVRGRPVSRIANAPLSEGPPRSTAHPAPIGSTSPSTSNCNGSRNGPILSDQPNEANIRTLMNQQKSLQQSVARLEKVAKDLTAEKTKHQKKQVPLDLSAAVREGYHEMCEDDIPHWDFSVCFDHPNNKEVNRTLIKNVQAVVDEEISNVALVKRAARTYFKTRKNRHRKVSSGKQAATAAEYRQRQRRHNKAHARKKALRNSTTLDEVTKKRVEPLLTAEYMSSDETAIEDSGDESARSDSSERSTDEPKTKKKKLIKHTLSWRSREMEEMVSSLDRKVSRRRTPRGKTMCLEVEVGRASTRPRPDNVPEWAAELFDNDN